MHNTDLLLAATGEDEDNLVIALLAKRHFAVARTLARVNDPDNAWLFDARWGVDIALLESAPLMSLIEEATGVADTVGLFRLAAAGHSVGELHLPSGTVVAAIVHGAQPVVPDLDYRFQPGDTVLVVTNTANDIHNAFQ